MSSPGRDEVVITAVDFDAPAARQLRDDQQRELRALYGGDTEPGVKPTAVDVSVFLLAQLPSGDAVACGGLRPLEPGAAEIKRMYVRPADRGRGLSRRLLLELEQAARSAGWWQLKLETGLRQHAAIALYESAGYARIEAFGAYTGPGSLCLGKDLRPGPI